MLLFCSQAPGGCNERVKAVRGQGKAGKGTEVVWLQEGECLGTSRSHWECFRRDMGPGRILKLVEEAGEGREERMWALKLQSTRDESGVT